MTNRIGHPNLVQFIGATTEGEMVILTELMLRKQEKKYLSTSQVIPIGQDGQICRIHYTILRY